jgi:hypothetical protein
MNISKTIAKSNLVAPIYKTVTKTDSKKRLVCAAYLMSNSLFYEVRDGDHCVVDLACNINDAVTRFHAQTGYHIPEPLINCFGIYAEITRYETIGMGKFLDVEVQVNKCIFTYIVTTEYYEEEKRISHEYDSLDDAIKFYNSI